MIKRCHLTINLGVPSICYNPVFVSTCVCVCVSSGCFCVYTSCLHFCQTRDRFLMPASAAFSLEPVLRVWSMSRAQKENRTVGKEPGQHSGQGPLELPMLQSNPGAFRRVIKLYNLCVKWFRQEIHLSSAQHLNPMHPPPLLYTYTFL